MASALIASSYGTRLLAGGLTLAIVGGLVQRPDNELLFEARNFFGTSRVLREGDVNQLKHGTTLHGIQPSSEEATRPASYYSWSSPLGRVIDRLHPRARAVGRPRRRHGRRLRTRGRSLPVPGDQSAGRDRSPPTRSGSPMSPPPAAAASAGHRDRRRPPAGAIARRWRLGSHRGGCVLLRRDSRPPVERRSGGAARAQVEPARHPRLPRLEPVLRSPSGGRGGRRARSAWRGRCRTAMG